MKKEIEEHLLLFGRAEFFTPPAPTVVERAASFEGYLVAFGAMGMLTHTCQPRHSCPIGRGMSASSPRFQPARALLEQRRSLIHQVGRKPDHIAQMLGPRAYGPFDAFAIAAPQQRLQLLQFVLKKIRCAGSVRDGRGVGRCRRGAPSHNSFSHVECVLSKVVHVMWSDGWGVSAPRPSPFLPRICPDAQCTEGPPRGEAVHPSRVLCVMPSLPAKAGR